MSDLERWRVLLLACVLAMGSCQIQDDLVTLDLGSSDDGVTLDLAPADQAQDGVLREERGFGGVGGALSTHGSFSMSAGGAWEEGDKDLGEGKKPELSFETLKALVSNFDFNGPDSKRKLLAQMEQARQGELGEGRRAASSSTDVAIAAQVAQVATKEAKKVTKKAVAKAAAKSSTGAAAAKSTATTKTTPTTAASGSAAPIKIKGGVKPASPAPPVNSRRRRFGSTRRRGDTSTKRTHCRWLTWSKLFPAKKKNMFPSIPNCQCPNNKHYFHTGPQTPEYIRTVMSVNKRFRGKSYAYVAKAFANNGWKYKLCWYNKCGERSRRFVAYYMKALSGDPYWYKFKAEFHSIRNCCTAYKKTGTYSYEVIGSKDEWAQKYKPLGEAPNFWVCTGGGYDPGGWQTSSAACKEKNKARGGDLKTWIKNKCRPTRLKKACKRWGGHFLGFLRAEHEFRINMAISELNNGCRRL